MKQLFIQLSFFFISGLINSIFCQQLTILNLSEAIEHPSKITASDFVGSIFYVPLATSPDCFVAGNPKVFVTKDYILTTTIDRCLLFDRKNGAFIREIGHYGRGPGEYRATIGFFNESSSTYYFIGWNRDLIKYSLDGVFRGGIKIPNLVDNSKSPSGPDVYSFLNDTVLACNFGIFDGTETNSIMIFTEKGKTIRIIPNKDVLNKKQKLVLRTKEITFHRFNNKLFFQSMYNDTVFNLTQKQIEPFFIINFGKHRPPFESRWWPIEKQEKSNFFLQNNILENEKFILFDIWFNKVRYFTLYDKLLKSLKIAEFKSGIKNDIDGFIDLKINSINNSGELSFLVQPAELIEWIKQNPDKFKSLKPELQKFKDIKMEDNPIVIIAK